MGIPIELSGPHKHEGEQATDQDPGAEKDLTVQIEVADLPIQMVANLQFGERQ